MSSTRAINPVTTATSWITYICIGPPKASASVAEHLKQAH